jgi:hypothetical protein
MSPDATLTVQVPTLSALPGALVEVRDRELRLKGRVAPGHALALSAGSYLATVTTPAGERLIKAVEVGAGDSVEVSLEVPSPALTDRLDERVLLADVPPQRGPFPRRVHGIGLEPPFIRFLAADDGRTIDGVETEPGPDALVVRNPGVEAVVLAQLEQAGQGAPWNVALPMASYPPADHCRLQLVEGADEWRASATPVGGQFVEALASYLITGGLRQAAELAPAAATLLREKGENPVAAALGGYVLLRLGRLDKLRDWPMNLANWFSWLPDGAIIAAELSFRRGALDEAERWVEEALHRGPPMFSDGLSLLVARLRPAAGSRPKGAERLLELSRFVDFAQLALAFPGADPTDPLGGYV